MITSKLSDTAPQSERSLNQQVVLEEDEYIEALSHVIARDFFPSLVHLDATNEYLDALHSRDPHLIGASVRRLEQVAATPLKSGRRLQARTPGRTPFGYTSDTPIHPRSENGEPQQKRSRYDTNMSLDDFQARYTSEDNSSFTQILDQENQSRKEKYGWAWDAQGKVEEQRNKMIEQRKRALIEAPVVPGVRGTFTIKAPTPTGLITDGKEKARDGRPDEDNSVCLTISTFTKKDDESRDVMASRKDRRPAGVDSWNFKARNSLMFTPDADVSPYHPPSATVGDSKSLKKVDYARTRLKEQERDVDDKSLSAPPSPTRNRVDAAIAGTSPTSKRSQLLVPDLPSPTPADLGATAMKQLMTWGTLNATPRVISETGDSVEPSAAFHIPEMTPREAIGRKLSNKAAKSLRVKAEMFTPRLGKMGTFDQRLNESMGPPSWTPRRSDAVGNLTPAARRLLERTAMPSRRTDMERSSGGQARDRDLDRVRWTPTPSASRE